MSRRISNKPVLPSQSHAWDSEYNKRGRLWAGAVNSRTDIPEKSRVLDLGCGNGRSLSALIRQPWQLTAIDFSSFAVALCNADPLLRSRADLAIADIRALPFADMSFDAVMAAHIIGHVIRKDRRKAADEMYRVLRPGGIFCCSEFTAFDFRSGRGREIEERTYQRKNGLFTHYFRQPEISGLFSRFHSLVITKKRWVMRVRGKDLVREEILATGKRPTAACSRV